MKPGDRVICIDAHFSEARLELGKTYIIVAYFPQGSIYTKGAVEISGSKHAWLVHRFIKDSKLARAIYL